MTKPTNPTEIAQQLGGLLLSEVQRRAPLAAQTFGATAARTEEPEFKAGIGAAFMVVFPLLTESGLLLDEDMLRVDLDALQEKWKQ